MSARARSGSEVVPDRAVRLLRQNAQLLGTRRRRTAEEVVGRLLGVQAQSATAFPLAVRARAAGIEQADVGAALSEDRSIVRTWAMRGTLHLIPAEVHGWLVELTAQPRLAAARRRLSQEGVADHERALGILDRTMSHDGPVTRAELADRLARRGVPSGGQAEYHLLRLAALEGLVCHGPDRDGEPTFVLVRDWLGPAETKDRDDAMDELVRRYLAGHGPAGPEDLVAWSGLRAGDVRRAWGRVAGGLKEIRTRSGPRWMGRTARPAPENLVRLLPAYDPYLVGWRTRDLVLPKPHAREVFPGGGLLRPAVIRDGRAIGSWKTGARGRDGLAVAVHPFARPDAKARRALEMEAADVGRFLGRAAVLEMVARP